MRKWVRWVGDGVWGRCSTGQLGGAIDIGGVRITGLRPLGGNRQKGITKAGRLSMCGDWNGLKVKVYSVHSGAQSALRQNLDHIGITGCQFPRVVAANECLVAEEWIEGEPVHAFGRKRRMAVAEKIDEFLECTRENVRVRSLAAEFEDAFCYLDDYLVKRLGAWVHWEPVAEFLESWRASRRVVMDEVDVRLSHPDLTARNLLVEQSTGSVFVVDNELLGIGQGWVVDRKNAALGCLDVPQLQTLGAQVACFISHTWRLRLLGSALDAGRLQRAYRLAKGIDWPE